MAQQDSQGRKRRSQAGKNDGFCRTNGYDGGQQKIISRENGVVSWKPATKGQKLQRTGSHEHVRRLVEQEGRAARNLLNFSVPLVDKQERKENNSRNPQQGRKMSAGMQDIKPQSQAGQGKDDQKSRQKERQRSRSATPDARRSVDLRARYWKYLGDNLQRAVEEIYCTCESDESILECEEVLMILDQCRKDFASLIDRIKLQTAFEKADSKDRPLSLAWEVRKMSPGKTVAPSPTPMIIPIATDIPVKYNAARHLDFNCSKASNKTVACKPVPLTSVSVQAPETKTPSSSSPSTPFGTSWADKVKGVNKEAKSPKGNIENTFVPIHQSSSEIHNDTPSSVCNGHSVCNGVENDVESDGEGWETVHHGRRHHHDSNSRQSRNKHKHNPKDKSRNNPNNFNNNNNKNNNNVEVDRKPFEDITSKHSGVSNRNNTRDGQVTNGKLRNLERIEVVVIKNPIVESAKELKTSQQQQQPLQEESSLSFNGLESLEEEKNASPSSSNCASVLSLDSVTVETNVQNSSEVDPDLEEKNVDESVRDESPALTEEPCTCDETKEEEEGTMDLTALLDDPLSLGSDDSSDERFINSEREKIISDAFDEEETLNREIEEEQDQAIATAIKHEEALTKEIEDEEALVNALHEARHMEASPDSSEGDEGQEDGAENDGDQDQSEDKAAGSDSMSWEELLKSYDDDQDYRETHSWGERVETGDARPPGHALKMHKKLSSPSRKRPLSESIKIHEEKQAKAEKLRERLIDDRLARLQNLSEKVDKVRELKNELIHQREMHYNDKQQRAELQRMLVLQEVVRKAQEEEAKVNEILFINTLEAQNKKIEVLSRHQGHEARLQDIQEERQRRREEQLAKENAVQERRKQLESERQARLEEIQQKRLEQEQKYKKEKEEKERAREEAAREKAREREQRLQARNEALQTAVEQLQIKIQQKQTESTRRHEQKLEQVKERAAGSSSRHSTTEEIPTVTPYERKKICTLCSVEIESEVYLLSHLRGKKHQQALDQEQIPWHSDDDKDTVSMKYIKDLPSEKNDEKQKADEERQKALRKRAKKLRTRMSSKGREYESNQTSSHSQDSPKRSKLQKILKDMSRSLQSQGEGPWPTNKVAAMDRSLGDLSRTLEATVAVDQIAFRNLGGVTALARLLLVIDTTKEKAPIKPTIPAKTVSITLTVLNLACKDCLENCQYLVLSNKIVTVIDLLVYQLGQLVCPSKDKEGKFDRHPGDPVSTKALEILSTVIDTIATASSQSTSKEGDAQFSQRCIDLISYLVCTGIIDLLRQYFNSVLGPIDEEPYTGEFLLQGMKLLEAIAKYLASRSVGMFEDKKEDQTQFTHTVETTDVLGVISLLYSIILQTGMPRSNSPPPDLSETTMGLTTEALRAINHIAVLDLGVLQKTLGAEGVSLEFRHIASHLLRVCASGKHDDLLHEVILSIGYFTVLCPDNQVFVQAGSIPTLLQQLCTLPFQYFSNPTLREILFPSLIAACFNNEENKKIVQQEVSCELLESYVEDQMLDSQQEKLLPSSHKLKSEDQKTTRIKLASRFPASKWSELQTFLKCGTE